MNAPASAARPEILLGSAEPDQLPLELAADGVLRYVWQSAFGPMLIEVREGRAFVNGEQVTPVAQSEGQPSDDAAQPPLSLVGRGG
jgi:hypothetical protein